MSSQRFQIGQRVIDYWDPYRYSSGTYAKISVGVVREVIPIDTGSFKYRVIWTHGPKTGKMTYKKHMWSFDEPIERRKEILGEWIKFFDDFCMNANKEPSL